MNMDSENIDYGYPVMLGIWIVYEFLLHFKTRELIYVYLFKKNNQKII